MFDSADRLGRVDSARTAERNSSRNQPCC